MTAPQAAPGLAELRDSPAWYPLEAAGQGAIRVLRLDEAGYQAASFLDQRLLQLPVPRATVAETVLASAAATLAPCSHFIFHIGHVGSTLLSRLLGSHAAFFALREPALLRALAAGQAGTPALAVVQSLLNRSWRGTERPLVKATSFVSELAEPLLAAATAPRALFVFAAPLAYVGGILGGAASRAETATLAPARLKRLVRRLGAAGWHFDPASEGEQVAMSWLCEMLTLQQAAQRHPRCGLWVDFDAFLQAPLPMLDSMFRALGAEADAGELEALIGGPIMRQYSKAPEHAYDAALRREVLAAAEWNHAAEIRRALGWLQAVAGAHAPVRALLESLPRAPGAR
jgi:hypothetical protein